MITRGPSAEETAEETVTETGATLSIAQVVFVNTTPKATNTNRTEKPLPTVTETGATLSIAQVVFVNTTPKATNTNRTEKPLPVYIGGYVQGSGVAKLWMS